MKRQPPKYRQQGVALILMAFIIGLIAAAFLLKTLNVSNLQAEQEKKTIQELNDAKQALIAWAVGHVYTPGQMPWPDRNGDGNYDGSSDCVTTPFQYSYLIGQLPSQPPTSPCLDPNNGLTVYAGLSTYPGLGREFRDAQGNRLWYAVSRNMVRDYVASENPIINSGMVNPPHVLTPYMRLGGSEAYPWIKVLDRNGYLVSNRVAAVIIAPGNVVGGQNRSAVAPNASEFLDSFQIGAAIYSNRGYATADEDFVIGEDAARVSVNDITFMQPYSFNDKLVFITIDELMTALEKRVAAEARNALRNFKAAVGNFPNAAGLNLATNSCVKGNLQGLLPIAPATNYLCTCTSSKSCSCHFAGVNSVKYTRASGVFGSSAAALPTGACSLENGNQTCSCSGAGGCKSSSGLTVQFTCDACGACTSSLAVSGSFQFVAKGSFSASASGCTVAGSNVNCSDTLAGTFAVDACTEPQFNSAATTSLLPNWFATNQWQNFTYYDATPGLTVGSKTGIQSILITTGSPVINTPFAISKATAQVRPSCKLNDYLDSIDNTDADATYEATNKLKTNNYNDQIFIVAP